ncbi:MAG: branched-chain amino acid ABC transporter permease, partial [Desulfatitalea sp.]|nr:branched-chain amino acid ABC transporter permease [Desulfatitalea sp.]NNK01063.1 branched-chain amino acid ABC transporter permease [Desulfatitalea sp.]
MKTCHKSGGHSFLTVGKACNEYLTSLKQALGDIPALGWLTGLLGAVLIEHFWGDALAVMIYLPKVPALFGSTLVLKKPWLLPSAMFYVFLIYILPVCLFARLSAGWSNRAAAGLQRWPVGCAALLHLLVLYGVIHVWAAASDYRLQVAKLIMIAVMLTLSLNVINGYMGEFSCSHPGFMAVGAYAASVVNLWLFKQDRLLGAPVLPEALGPYCFPLALFIGGIAASLGALIVAVPSFRTRGDYLAIISLAFMFMVKSFIENMEWIGGPRGMGSQPNWS